MVVSVLCPALHQGVEGVVTADSSTMMVPSAGSSLVLLALSFRCLNHVTRLSGPLDVTSISLGTPRVTGTVSPDGETCFLLRQFDAVAIHQRR